MLCVLIGLFVAPGAVAAQDDDDDIDPVPAAYYGDVTVDGEHADAGVDVTAELDGETYGPIATDGNGEFGGSAAADEKLVVDPDEAPDDQLVTFYVDGEQADETATWDPAGSTEISLSVDELPDDADDSDDSDDSTGSDDSGSGGQGQAGDGDAGSDDDGPSGPPSIDGIRTQLESTDASSESDTEISDSESDSPGTTVRPDGTESVQGITFNDESVEGSVEVREYSQVSRGISDDISDSVANEVDGAEYNTDTGSSDGSVTVHSVSDITPTTTAGEDTSATVELTVDSSRVDDPDQLTVVKETYSFAAQTDRWEQLETTVDDSADEITLEAEVESFSLFAITEIETQDEPTEETTDDTADADDSEADTDDSVPGFGLPAAIAALLAATLIAYRRQ